jgi:hypothetical protein
MDGSLRQILRFEALELLDHRFLGGREHAIEAPQHRHR